MELLKDNDEGSIRNCVSTSDNSDNVTADEMTAYQAALDAIVFKKWDYNPPATLHVGGNINKATEQRNKLQVVTTKPNIGEDKRSIKKIWAPPTPTKDPEHIEDADENGISTTTSTSTLGITEDTSTDIQLEVRPMDDISTVGSTTEEQTSAETATATGSAAEEKSDNTDSNSSVMTTAAPPTMETKAASTITSEKESIGSSSNILKETTITTTNETMGTIRHHNQQKDVYHLEALASAIMKRSTTSSTDAISCINATNVDTYKPQKFFKKARLHLAWEPPPEQKTKVMVAYSVYLDVTFSGPCRMFRHEHKDCKHDHFVKNTNNY
ncbi:uncharacterized protein Dmoj_GI26140 [Drosophila mojavensis]|uniref:Uncharacterized protein n=1 Tax=Drosophila mojavensis TaxID=7230 RepID=A0A0Q9XV88_DROMO|nr:uncharacterized protein Dmoj_GI26140 [Drosophila mojavensis]